MESVNVSLKTKVVGLGLVFVTLLVSPGITYDPINLPKMTALVLIGALIYPSIVLNFPEFWRNHKRLVFTTATLVLAMLTSVPASKSPLNQQLWGIWGRSTGLITYLCLISILLFFARQSLPSSTFLIMLFMRVGYFLTFYTFLQLLDLDPIDWSQKALVATLGNINFMSSFFGLTMICYFAHLSSSPALSTKIFFGLFIAANSFLIFYSGSYQGFAIFLAGLVFYISFKFYKQWNKVNTVWFLISAISCGLLLFMGTLGMGPLGSILFQETMKFRLDYWKAGVSMTLSNPLQGLGMDSYGDNYTIYRDEGAALNGSAGRVTNTAHNVFLDLSSGAGVLAGVSFIAVFVICVVGLLHVVERGANRSNLETASLYAGLVVGYAVFCLISINQIGIAVWGFAFLGVASGLTDHLAVTKEYSFGMFKRKDSMASKLLNERKKTLKGKDVKRLTATKERKTIETLMTGFSLMLMVLIAFPIVQNDIDFLKALRSNDLGQMIKIAQRDSSAGFYQDKLLTLLVDQGKISESVELAEEFVISNPKRLYPWKVLAFSEISDSATRSSAIEKLSLLDPQNVNLRIQLDALRR